MGYPFKDQPNPLSLWSILDSRGRANSTLDIFDRRNTYYKVEDSKMKVTQVADAKTLGQGIIFDVRQKYFNVLQAEKSVGVAANEVNPK